MGVSVVCTCGKRLKAKDEGAGRTAKCPACGNPVTFPALKAAVELPVPSVGLGDETPFSNPTWERPVETEPTPPSPPPLPKNEWHYTQDGERQGPVSFSTLQQLAASGRLNPRELVWKAGMADWLPASTVDGLSSDIPPVPKRVADRVEPGLASESGQRQEQNLLEKGGVTVSNVRFILPGHTYAVSGITSVRSGKQARTDIVMALLLLASSGIISVVTGINGLMSLDMSNRKGICFIVVGVLLLIAFLKTYNYLDEYVVILATAGSEQHAFISPDRQLVVEIVEALDKAIVARG